MAAILINRLKHNNILHLIKWWVKDWKPFFKPSRQRFKVKINGQEASKFPSDLREKMISVQDPILGALLQGIFPLLSDWMCLGHSNTCSVFKLGNVKRADCTQKLGAGKTEKNKNHQKNQMRPECKPLYLS